MDDNDFVVIYYFGFEGFIILSYKKNMSQVSFSLFSLPKIV